VDSAAAIDGIPVAPPPELWINATEAAIVTKMDAGHIRRQARLGNILSRLANPAKHDGRVDIHVKSLIRYLVENRRAERNPFNGPEGFEEAKQLVKKESQRVQERIR
jgi:hypothetical protein